MDIDRVRTDFPILGQRVYDRPFVYLDNAATAQKPARVIEVSDRLYRELNANIHRGVHYMSEQCTSLYEDARQRIGRFIGCDEREELIFTAGATAGLNTVAYSYGERFFRPGDNIVVSEMEHHSNIVPWQIVCARKGTEIRVLPFDDRGELRTDLLPGLLDERTRLVAVTQASNVLGTEPDLEPIIRMAHDAGAVVVVDGCQGVVHEPTDVHEMGCDFYAFSGHKLYGPNGIGVLYGRRELLERMPPFIAGGDMVEKVTFAHTAYAPLPLKFEGGTANYVGAIGLAEAVAYLESLDLDAARAHEQALLDYSAGELEKIDGLTVYGHARRKCSIVSFNVEGVHNYDIGMVLDKLGIAVRTGAHCADPVMEHYGVRGMCRASYAFYNTFEEADALTEGVRRAVKMLRH